MYVSLTSYSFRQRILKHDNNTEKFNDEIDDEQI